MPKPARSPCLQQQPHLPFLLPVAGDQGCYPETCCRNRLHKVRISRGQVGADAASYLREVTALAVGRWSVTLSLDASMQRWKRSP
jgi:hypothetical protein